MEELAHALGELTASGLASVFRPEVIVVSGRGMERWLAMRLSRAHGISANTSFPFPRAFVESLLDVVVPEHASTGAAHAPASMVWAILDAMVDLAAESEFALVRSYVADDARGDKAYGFARRVAELFDRYTVHRPELIRSWEAGQGSGFQPLLWRELVRRLGPGHVARRVEACLERLARSEPLSVELPERVSLFGVASLPPLYVDLLAKLGARIDVHAFLLCPSDVAWQNRALAGRGAGPLSLITRVEREFQAVLQCSASFVDVGRARFHDPGSGSVLALVQSDLARGDPSPPVPSPLSRLDDSLTIHACHSPLREMEVLREQLLTSFQRDSSLRPEDVIVMMPDVETYGPYVHAVFGVEPAHEAYIPYRITDRPRRSLSTLARAYEKVLGVLGGRLSASEVVDLLRHAPIRDRFGIDPADLPRLEAWVSASGARSCVDASHRAELGLPEAPEHTWRFGLDRLLLGYAMPGQGATLFAGTLPFDGVEGTSARVVGQLAELVETLAELRQKLRAARPLAAWRDAHFDLLRRMLVKDDAEPGADTEIREALAALADSAALAGFSRPVERVVFERALSEALESPGPAHDFLAGGVTFSALLPMRSIPFRVVCLAGMNDGEFPRAARALDFDEMAKDARPGDRSARDDDRHSFLEALLSARDRLVITYVGRTIQEDRVRPPSVVVGELLDRLDLLIAPLSAPSTGARAPAAGRAQLELFGPRAATEGSGSPAPRRASDELVIVHPLQGFSPRYFGGGDDPRLWSHSQLDLEGAKALLESHRGNLTWFDSPIRVPAESDVELDALVQFFEHPIRALLERECGVRLRAELELMSEREPVELDPLERWELGSFLLERQLAGQTEDAAFHLARAAGLLPHGALGDAEYSFVRLAVGAVARESRAARRGAKLRPVPVELAFPEARLQGVLSDLWTGGQVRHTFSRTKGKTLLALWIRHLGLCACAPEGVPLRSVLVARAGEGAGVEIWELPEVGSRDAQRHLQELVQLREVGRTAPLPLFPESAFAYVDALRRHSLTSDPEAKADAAARAVWQSARSPAAESLDAWNHAVFAGQNPLDPSFLPAPAVPGFRALARRLFEPLLALASVREVLS